GWLRTEMRARALEGGVAVVQYDDRLGLPLAEALPRGLETGAAALGEDVVRARVLADQLAHADATDGRRRGLAAVVEESGGPVDARGIERCADLLQLAGDPLGELSRAFLDGQ